VTDVPSAGSARAIVAEHDDMVRGLARSIATELGVLRDLDDLVSCGFEGLLRARERYDASRDVPFEAFAYRRVRGAIYDGVRTMGDLPRRALERLERAAAAAAAIEEGADERVRAGEDRDDVNGLAGAIDELFAQLAASQVTLALAADERRSNPEEAYVNAFERRRLERAIGALEDREAAVIRSVYFEGRTLDDVAENVFRVSRSMASRIHVRALGKLRASLG